MKYLNIRGFKAGEASCSCQQTDPLQPSRGPVSGLQPAPHVGHKSAAHISTVRPHRQVKGRHSQMKPLPSPNTRSHGHTVFLLFSCSATFWCYAEGGWGGAKGQWGQEGYPSAVTVGMLKHSTSLRSSAAHIFMQKPLPATFSVSSGSVRYIYP